MDEVGIFLRTSARQLRDVGAVPLVVAIDHLQQKLFCESVVGDVEHRRTWLCRGSCRTFYCEHLLPWRQTVGSCLPTAALVGQREGVVQIIRLMTVVESTWYGGQPDVRRKQCGRLQVGVVVPGILRSFDGSVRHRS